MADNKEPTSIFGIIMGKAKPDDNYVDGTNCYNCTYTYDSEEEDVKPTELNEQGGMKSAKDDKAAQADLITLPGKMMPGSVTSKKWCKNKNVDQYVTCRNCCAFWDNPATKREFGKEIVGDEIVAGIKELGDKD